MISADGDDADAIWVMPVQIPPGSHQRLGQRPPPGAGGLRIQNTPHAGERPAAPRHESDDARPRLDTLGSTPQGAQADRLDPALGPVVLLGEQGQAREDAEQPRAGQRRSRPRRAAGGPSPAVSSTMRFAAPVMAGTLTGRTSDTRAATQWRVGRKCQLALANPW